MNSTRAPGTFLLNPPKTKFPKDLLPAPLVGGPKDSYVPGDNLTLAEQSENGLPTDYYPYLVSGGTGQTSKTPDKRITDVDSLPPGPFQLTNDTTFTYNSYAASPVHRFYRCGNSWIVVRSARIPRILQGAKHICSRGWKLR